MSQPGTPPTGVLFISTPGCVTCRAVRALVSELDGRLDVAVVEVSAPAEPELVSHHRVLAAPTLIALHDGVEVGRHTGAASPAALRRLADAAAAGSDAGRSPAPASLIALRVAATAVVMVVGTATSTPTLMAIGAVLAVWTGASLIHQLYELRTR